MGRRRLISQAGIASLSVDLTKDSVDLEADTLPKFKEDASGSGYSVKKKIGTV